MNGNSMQLDIWFIVSHEHLQFFRSAELSFPSRFKAPAYAEYARKVQHLMNSKAEPWQKFPTTSQPHLPIYL